MNFIIFLLESIGSSFYSVSMAPIQRIQKEHTTLVIQTKIRFLFDFSESQERERGRGKEWNSLLYGLY